LAFSSPMTLDTVVSRGLKAYTTHTLTTVEELRKALSAVRLSRVAVSRWEWVAGVSTVAVPVFGGGGKVLAALELTVRDLRTDLRTLHPVLIVAARSLSRELANGHAYDRAPLTLREWGIPTAPASLESEHRLTAGL